MSFPTRPSVLIASIGVAALLAGCSATSSPTGTENGTSTADTVAVTTSTNVWGDVAKAIGGDAVNVQSIIDDPSMDPHSYESTPSDATKVTKADLVVFNGAGYDEFIEKILQSTGAKQTVEAHNLAKENGTAVEGAHGEKPAEGEKHEGEENSSGVTKHADNEHYWYDLDVVRRTAVRIGERLGEIRPARKDVFAANVKAFTGRIDDLAARADRIAGVQPGAKVLLTEPVAALLTDRLKLVDVTPPAFAHAVEEQQDPSVASIAQTHRLVSGGGVATLLFNPQTESPITKVLKEKATAGQVPVVEVTETLPEGRSYLNWMSDNLANLEKALTR